MLVAMLVVAITFGLMLYNQVLQPQYVVTSEDVVGAGEQAYSLALDTGADAEAFFNRLLLEARLGMVDNSLIEPFASQTGIYEGAACRLDGGMNQLVFPHALPQVVRLKVTPRQALTLGKVAEGLSGQQTDLVAYDSQGIRVDFKDFIQYNGGDNSVYLRLTFK
jgi:hypothetical protein